jgi:putative ABC transport system permease protein
MTVTPSFFRVLRGTAARGRLFTDADGEVGREHVAVLAYAFAARQPAGMDHVVGTTLRLNNEVYTVVGVLPQNFTFLNPEEQVWMPAAFKPEDRAEDQRYSQNNDEIGRLASGVTVQQAQARVNAFNATLLDRAGSLKQN